MRRVCLVLVVGVLALTGCGGDKPAAAPKACDFGPGYQCQPINNDAALQRLANDIGSQETLGQLDQLRNRLNTELCNLSLVLTGVELPAGEDPLIQRVRRIEEMNPGLPIDPGTVGCAVQVRGAPPAVDPKAGIGCVFSDGSQCQPVNNDAAQKRIQARLDAASTVPVKLGVLVEEACAVDRVTSGPWAPPADTPLTRRWATLSQQYGLLAGTAANVPGLVQAEASRCPGTHSG